MLVLSHVEHCRKVITIGRFESLKLITEIYHLNLSLISFTIVDTVGEWTLSKTADCDHYRIVDTIGMLALSQGWPGDATIELS